jgi:hypothetical protein
MAPKQDILLDRAERARAEAERLCCDIREALDLKQDLLDDRVRLCAESRKARLDLQAHRQSLG